MSILDKEYLAFSNATNLDWQFNSLAEVLEGKSYRPPKFHELLSPDKFVKRNAKGEITGYVYGATGKTYNQSQGLTQMQNSAGILMNYLEECEKNSGEGNFLKEWEVVYGADNYQIALDYLDSVISELKSSLGKMPEKLVKIDTPYLYETFKASVLMEYAPDYGEELLENDNIKLELSPSLEKIFLSTKQYVIGIVNSNYIKYRNEIKKSLETYEKMRKEIPSREEVGNSANIRESAEAFFDSVTAILRGFSYGIEIRGIQNKANQIAKLNQRKTLWENYEKGNPRLKDEVEKILAPNKKLYENKKIDLKALQDEALKNKWISRGKSGKAFYILDNKYYEKCEKLDKSFKGSIIKIDNKKITKDLEILILDEEKTQKNIVANFLETVTGNVIGGEVRKVIKDKKNTVSHICTMGLALFTRANFADFLNTATGIAKEYVIARINKDLYLPVEEKKGRREGYREDMPLYDTGFRVVVFKKENNIVIACKKGHKDIESRGLKSLDFVYKRMKRIYPNSQISFTGYEEGARIVSKYSLSEAKSNVKSVLFYTSNKNGIQDMINFDKGDFSKQYQGNLSFYVIQGGKEVSQMAGYVGAGYLFAQVLKGTFVVEGVKFVAVKYLWYKPGELIGGIVAKTGVYSKLGFLKIGGFWGLVLATLISIIVPLIIQMIKAYLENKEDDKIYAYLDKRGWISKGDNIIKGYITDKYSSDKSISIGNYNVEKSFGTFYIFKLPNKKIVPNLSSLGNTQNRIYIEYATSKTSTNQIQYTSYFYYVLKNEEGVYCYEKAIKIDVYENINLKINREVQGEYQNSRILAVMLNMDLALEYQRNYEKIRKNNLHRVIYLDYDRIKVGTYLPKETKAYYEKYYDENKVTIPSRFINEYVFLPYMSSGNISNTIREDYVKNAYKEIIYIMTQNEVVEIKNEESLENFVKRTLKTFAGRIDYFLTTMIPNPNGTYPKAVKMNLNSIDYKKWLVYFTPIISKENYLKKEVILELVKATTETVKGRKKYIALNIKMKDKDMKYGYDKNGTMFRQDRHIKVGEKVVKQMNLIEADTNGRVLLKGGGRAYIN